MTIHFSDTAQRVLVTGATGFIGQLLVQELLADGHRVIALTRDSARAAASLGAQVRCIDAMHKLPPEEHIDVVINLAGARILGWRWTASRRRTLLQSRVGVTDGVVAWIAQARYKPRLMLSASAIGYYGIQRQGDNTPLDENSPPQPIFMSELCQAWEASARKAAVHGVQVMQMRFGLVLGKGGALPMMLLPIKLGVGGPLGGGHQWLSWIHVQDLLRGMAHLWHLSERQANGMPDIGGAYNFTAPESVPQREFSSIAAALLHRPSLLPTPGLPMRLMLGEQSELLLEGQRVVPQRLQSSGFVFRYPELRVALRDCID
jgi:hypothetical protein